VCSGDEAAATSAGRTAEDSRDAPAGGGQVARIARYGQGGGGRRSACTSVCQHQTPRAGAYRLCRLLSVDHSIRRACRLLLVFKRWPCGNLARCRLKSASIVHVVMFRPHSMLMACGTRCRSCLSVCVMRAMPRAPSTATASSRSVRLHWRRSKPGARRF